MLFEDKSLSPYEGDKPYVFLSYSHEDAEEAAEIIGYLKKNQYLVWYDEGITPGDEWDENVAVHLKRCGFFLALMSNRYIQSQNCRDELAFARDYNKPTVLVYLENTELPPGLDMRVGILRALYKKEYKDQNAFYTNLQKAEGLSACRETPLSESEVEDGSVKKDPEDISQGNYTPPPKNPKIWPIIALGVVVAAVLGVFLFRSHEQNKVPDSMET